MQTYKNGYRKNTTNKHRRCIPAITLTALLLLMTSCESSPEILTTDTAAGITFPAFPSPYIDGVSVVIPTADYAAVSMPMWYWLNIVDYAADVDTAVQIIKARQQVLYENKAVL